MTLEVKLLCSLIVALGSIGLFELVLTLLNVRHVYANRFTVPEFARGSVPAETHMRACRYTRDKGYLAIAEGGLMLILTLMVVASGLLGFFDDLLRQFLPEWMAASHYYHGCAYILILSLLSSLPALPFQYYRQFVLEERYGFNTTTVTTWCMDALKGMVLSVCFMIPLLCGLFYFMESSGALWWLWAWAFLMSFQLLLLFIYPVFIAPLFNTFTPLEDDVLREQIESLASTLQFATDGIFVMDGSRRSRHANAYFAGLGSQKRIVLFDTLISLLSPAQILAVLAHEIGHEKKRHIVKSILLMSAVSLAAFYLFSRLISVEALYHALGFSGSSPYAALLVFSLCMEPLLFLMKPVFSAFSRTFEYQADRYALRATGGARDLSEALFALSENSLAALQPHPLYSAVYYSHPTIGERVLAMQQADSC